LEAVKLGEVQTLILTLLAKKAEGLSTGEIMTALKRDRVSYVSRPINTLITNHLVKHHSTEKPVGQGRPGKIYAVTVAGVGRYIYDTRDYSVLEIQKALDPYIGKLNDIYKALEGYDKREEIMSNLINVSLNLSVEYDAGDTLYMGGAYMLRRLERLPNKYKKKLAAITKNMFPRQTLRHYTRLIEEKTGR